MGQVYFHQGTRCQEHPHRSTEQRCDRCRRPFCDDCLAPGERRADGTRGWYCAPCLGVLAADREQAEREQALGTRVRRLGRRARTAALVAGTGGLFVAVLFAAVRPFAGQARPVPIQTRCGELSRIRSVGAIGTQGEADSVNVFAYPQRAEVRFAPGGTAGGAPAGAADPAAVVDECDTGWRVDARLQLPVTLTLDTGRTGTYIQRIALWQDPTAPRESWVHQFEVLASPSESGDDFVPLFFDRPTQLRETTEPQWFEIVRPSSTGQPASDVAAMRRLAVRVVSTHGSARARAEVESVSLGEVAAYGPDLELAVSNQVTLAGEVADRFVFLPADIRALAGQPKFVLVLNRSKTATHVIATTGQTRNLELRVEPGQARSGQFVASPRPGRFEFFCKVPGHDINGLVGTLLVR